MITSKSQELERLHQLTDRGCTDTPRLMDYECLTQDDKLWLSGGYIVFSRVWARSREERDEIILRLFG